jgi:hypothetical protein
VGKSEHKIPFLINAKEIVMKANTTFHYGLVRVSELGIESTLEQRSPKKPAIHLDVNGERLATSQRFWTSFFHRFGISETVFKYFDHDEVFGRIAERGKGDTVR